MTANWQNRTLFHGDNLKFLRAMNSESVDLIATDPPFNKGRDFHATPDSLAAGAKFQDRWSWERDVHEEWVDQITDDYPRLMEAIESARYAHSDGMGAFMCFMAVRLLEMRRVLRPTGSIYLHCDPTASHYLKAVMDAVFGWKQFRNEIVWSYRRWPSKSRKFQTMHESLLFFVKGGGENTFNVQHEPASESYLKRFKGKTQILDPERKTRKLPVDAPTKGMPLRAVWDISFIAPASKERTGYPTQKPLALYERIIRASSNEGDIVLDPFAGCATTLVAAEKLGRQWVGMDIWERAHEVVVERLKEATGLFGEILYETVPPERTDEGDEAAPFLRVKERIKEPEGRKMSRAEMYDFLLAQHGPVCQGCDWEAHDPRHLELDHNIPRSDGGINHITNRILLCGPCNKLKSNIYTLSGLRRENKKRGYLQEA
ncbi:MAG: DNA methyltransferase [Nitrospinae bacterium]|nr:DNA methyltransferase [Nitrospinota bacterium]